jgi:hypothetical protein
MIITRNWNLEFRALALSGDWNLFNHYSSLFRVCSNLWNTPALNGRNAL